MISVKDSNVNISLDVLLQDVILHEQERKDSVLKTMYADIRENIGLVGINKTDLRRKSIEHELFILNRRFKLTRSADCRSDLWQRMSDLNLELFGINTSNRISVNINKQVDQHRVKHNACPVCCVNQSDSVHHIIPKIYGGDDSDYNKISLCKKCHDIIELSTDELLSMKPDYTANRIRRLILIGALSE